MEKELRRQDDELMHNLQTRFDRHLEIYAQNNRELASLKNEVVNLGKSINELKHTIVSRAEFKPIRMLAYGMVGIILTTIAGALLALILK